ncbi:SDR family NAD(P)-dependent oxidoreductase [Streptomyces sp. G45]|uniref:SDR family NAD(P)-dependent oxidoreductase n=1 Tax=Streptomyces sp. G45 TaxID=3406627 RepID=UPI003C2288F1
MAAQQDLAGRTALVTGAGRGLGAAVARALHDRGASVAAVDRDEDGLRCLAADLGRVLAVPVDLATPRGVDEAHERAVDGLGPVDILVNNAAIAPARSLWEIAADEWDQVFAVNLRAAFFLTRRAAEGMRRRRSGRVVNVASVAGQTPRGTSAHYGISKAGLLAMTKNFAAELAPYDVTVNAVAPAMIRTPMVGTVSDETLRELTEKTPLRRIAEPEEVAAVVAFLAADTGAFITGATYDINGGILMR